MATVTIADLVNKYGIDKTVEILVANLGWSPEEAQFIIALSTGMIDSDVIIGPSNDEPVK